MHSSAALTEWKKSEELAFLAEVSSVPLQQALRHLQTAFVSFFAKRAQYPRYKSRKKSWASDEYTRSAFTWRDGKLTLAKMTKPVVIEDLTVRNLLTNGTLARAISDAAWTQLRSMLEYKCAWYGRELIVIDHFFPSSKLCGTCGTI